MYPKIDVLFQEVKRSDDVPDKGKLLFPWRKCGWFPDGRKCKLKGGGPSGPVNSRQIPSSLRLINNRSQATRNICFANSVVQLLRSSGYALLLRTQFPQFILGKPLSCYQGCKALFSLYSEQSNRERSAASLRKLVAQKSGKYFLADGNQEDSEEFLRAVISMMSDELHGWDAFDVVNNEHIGLEKIKRKFLDNGSGVCSKCGQFPSCSDQRFLCLKLTIPNSRLPVDLDLLIFRRELR